MNNDKKLKPFLPLSRSFFKHNFWHEKREFSRAEAWLYLIASAETKPKEVSQKGRLFSLQPGELVTARRFLATAFNWSEKKVRSFLKLLEGLEMIVTETTKEGTIISLCNFEEYNKTEGQKSKRPTKGPQKARQKARQKAQQKADKIEAAEDKRPNKRPGKRPTKGPQKAQNNRIENKDLSLNKEKKEKKKKGAAPPFEEVKAYFDEKGLNEALAKKFFSYYYDEEKKIFTKSNGAPLLVWKKAASSWSADALEKGRYLKSAEASKIHKTLEGCDLFSITDIKY